MERGTSVRRKNINCLIATNVKRGNSEAKESKQNENNCGHQLIFEGNKIINSGIVKNGKTPIKYVKINIKKTKDKINIDKCAKKLIRVNIKTNNETMKIANSALKNKRNNIFRYSSAPKYKNRIIKEPTIDRLIEDSITLINKTPSECRLSIKQLQKLYKKNLSLYKSNNIYTKHSCIPIIKKNSKFYSNFVYDVLRVYN